jgi:hypothetical protein
VLAARLRHLGRKEREAGVLAQAIRHGHILAILDGFDELGVHLSAVERAGFLAELRSLAAKRAKVMITLRTHLFQDAKEERLHFKGKDGPADRAGLEPGGSTVVYLLPFDRVRIQLALEKMVGNEAGGVLDLIDRVYDLKDLASRPVLLTMIAGAVARLCELETDGLTVGASGVYEKFVDEWLERDNPKHDLLTPDEKKREMSALAARLWLLTAEGEQAPGIHWQELPGWLQERLGLSRIERDAVASNIRTAAFLIRNSEENYRFAHRSFIEFFLARGIAARLADGDLNAIDVPPLSREVIAFAIELMRRAGNGAGAVEALLEGKYRPQASENAARRFAARQHLLGVEFPSIRCRLRQPLTGRSLGMIW